MIETVRSSAFVLLALAAVAVACSANPADTVKNEGNAASSSSTSSSAGGGPSSSSTSSGGGTPTTTLGAAYCAYYEKCDPAALAPFGDEAACATALDGRVEEVKKAPGYNLDAARLAACAAKLQARGCGDPDPVECDPAPGTLAAGAPCLEERQCAGGACVRASFSDRCGKCAALGKAGADCSEGKPDCERGLFCDFDGEKCKAVAAEGAACTLETVCAAGLRCIADKCAKAVPENGACTEAGFECADAFDCVNGKCTKRTIAPAKIANLGESCDSGDNGPFITCRASYCDDLGTKKCLAFKKDGEACEDNTGCAPLRKCIEASAVAKTRARASDRTR